MIGESKDPATIAIEGADADGRRAIAARLRLRLAFHWTGDRWAHTLESDRDGALVLLARSLEADPRPEEAGGIPSPAYQQLGFQRSGAEVQALLVGQAGPHHYSAVFSIAEGEAGVIIAVDVADRCRAPAPALACTYWVDATSSDLREADPARIAWEPAACPGGLLAFEGAAGARIALAEAGRRATRVQALAPPLAAGEASRRCRYRWHWRDPGRSP